MEGLGLVPDVVLVSSSRRTLQTMQELEPWPETPLVEQLDTLYLADAEGILNILRTTAETVRSLLLIGHNPGLHEVATMLAGGVDMPDPTQDQRRLVDAYPSGALAEFALAKPWHQLDRGGARLVRFICPRDLSDVA